MSKDEYLITDAPLKALTVFAMPMILGSFFQQVYNMADSIIVGQFVGSSALAAVGACAALTNVFICVALGAGVGAGVLVSRYFGAQNYSKMKTIVSTSLISFLILSILLGVFGFGFSHFMMSLLQTPADILDEAVLYLRVYFVGFPFLFMYNILSTMFNSIGESKIPLGLLIFSSVLNIVMDLWMVAGLGLGVFGAAPQPKAQVHDLPLPVAESPAGSLHHPLDFFIQHAADRRALFRQPQRTAVTPAALRTGHIAVFLQIVQRAGDCGLILLAPLAQLRRGEPAAL